MHTRLLRSTLFFACLAQLATGCPPVDDDDSGEPIVDDDDTAIDYGAPPTAIVDLIPDAPSADDILVASIHTEDPEGMEVFTQVRWLVDGADADAWDDLMFVPASATEVGEEWTVTVIPSDGGQDGAASSDSVVIGNGLPVLFAVTIAPQDPAEGDDVVATIGGTMDPDGDTVSVSFAWWVDGAVSAVTGGTLTSADFDKGDTIWVVATPDDGLSEGASVISNVVVATNTPPTATGATVDPTAGTEVSTFTCTGEGFDDADGDSEGWLYTWEINGVFQVDGATLDGAWFDRGDYLVCQVWPDDGQAPGEMVAATPIQVANTAPAVASVTITPDPATSSDVLTAGVGALTDIDGDTVTPLYAWTVDGVPAGDGALLEPAGFARDASVVVTVTPTDGTDEGAALASAAVSIGNSAPAFTGADLAFDPPTNTYVATGLGWSDVDGDAEGYVYAWANAAGALAETTGVLDAATLSSPDTVTVTMTANDGTDDGNTLTSVTLSYAPAAEVAPPIAHFGTVDEGCTTQGQVLITNVGTGNLEISDITLTETVGVGYLSIVGTYTFPLSIVQGGELQLLIEYAGLDTSESAGELVITSNDPAQPTITVPVFAAAEPGELVTERFFWDDEDEWVLPLTVLIPPTEILVGGDPETDFVFNATSNAIEFGDDIDPSDGYEILISYVPSGEGCSDNLAPVVVASLVTATPGACEPTLIDATESYDPEGDAFWFGFDFAAQPATSTLTGDSVSDLDGTISVLADEDGAYELDIHGIDELGAAGAPAAVAFDGLAGGGGGAFVPVADAGPDLVGAATADCWLNTYGALDCTTCSGAPLRLDGTGSNDPDGTGLVYTWSQLSGDLELTSYTESTRPFVELDPDADTMVFSPNTLTAEFELTVTDCDGQQATDTVTVEVVCTANVLGYAEIYD